MDIVLTKHAYDRMRERFRYNRKAAERIATKAYENGILHGETTGQLYKYISGKAYAYLKKGTKILIYGEIVYIFIEQPEHAKLITSFHLPKSLKNAALGLQERKKTENV